MNENNEKCDSCIYSVWLYGPSFRTLGCQYIIIERKERGCKGGNECTKYKRGSREDRKNYFTRTMEGDIKYAQSKRLHTLQNIL